MKQKKTLTNIALPTLSSLILTGLALTGLTACTTGSALQNSANDEPVYPIREVIEGLYINDYQGRVTLFNPYKNDNFSEYTYQLEPYNQQNLNMVDFYGQPAIRLTYIETGFATNGDKLYSDPSYYFLNPKNKRLLGIQFDSTSDGNHNDLITSKLYEIPKDAYLGSSNILSEGYLSSFLYDKELLRISSFTKEWKLTEYSHNSAKLCIIKHTSYTHNNNVSEWHDCYIITQNGKVLSKEVTGNYHIDKENYNIRFSGI